MPQFGEIQFMSKHRKDESGREEPSLNSFIEVCAKFANLAVRLILHNCSLVTHKHKQQQQLALLVLPDERLTGK